MIGIIDITLNNKPTQLIFANYALEQYNRLTGVGVGEVKQLDENYSQLDMVADLVYCGLYGYYRRNNKVIDFTHDEVKGWVDDLSYADQLLVIKEFTSSCLEMTNQMLQAFKAMAADSNSEEKKK